MSGVIFIVKFSREVFRGRVYHHALCTYFDLTVTSSHKLVRDRCIIPFYDEIIIGKLELVVAKFR